MALAFSTSLRPFPHHCCILTAGQLLTCSQNTTMIRNYIKNAYAFYISFCAPLILLEFLQLTVAFPYNAFPLYRYFEEIYLGVLYPNGERNTQSSLSDCSLE